MILRRTLLALAVLSLSGAGLGAYAPVRAQDGDIHRDTRRDTHRGHGDGWNGREPLGIQGPSARPPRNRGPQRGRTVGRDSDRLTPRSNTLLPLGTVLRSVRREVPGRVLNAQLRGSRYRIRLVTPEGQVVYVVASARSGRVLRVIGAR
jgi:uncharacterized membrane protein YkoI